MKLKKKQKTEPRYLDTGGTGPESQALKKIKINKKGYIQSLRTWNYFSLLTSTVAAGRRRIFKSKRKRGRSWSAGCV